MKSKSNFKQFEKKEDCHSICISEITECQRLGQTWSKKQCLRTSFESQHVKASETIVKSA